MSEAFPLPPRPNLEQYKKLAKDLQYACKSSNPGVVRNWAARWAESIARLQSPVITPEIRKQIDLGTEQIEQRWHKFKKVDGGATRCTLADSQFFMARAHGFESWPKFARHLEALARTNSPISNFEAAAEAIVDGDSAMLNELLTQHPDLVHARSTREHRSTLLHYVSANGIEDFRQRTPNNIIEITKLLLNAGVDVNAESEAYGGRPTTLALTATSWYPENAGVQLPLLDLLIGHGAIIDGSDGASTVNACLHNGRGQAAEFLAGRGARLDLEAAAGLGRLDLVKDFFQDDGGLRPPPATGEKMKDGFAWACEFGRTSIVDFMLHRGMAIDAKLRHHGQTGLHWAAYGGHTETVKLLLERGAPVEAKDETYSGTPLGWALYSWNKCRKLAERGKYCEVVALLIRAGAKLDPQRHDCESLPSDPRMLAALRGELPRS
jgi:hypothetical protein